MRNHLCILWSAFTCEKHTVRLQQWAHSVRCECNQYVQVCLCLCKGEREKVPSYQIHFNMQPGLIKQYGKGSRAVKSSLLTFSLLYKREWDEEWGGLATGLVTTSVKGRTDIYNENNQVAPGADGEEILLIIGSIIAPLKCNSLSQISQGTVRLLISLSW